MKFKIVVVERRSSVREVEAKDYAELKQKIEEDGSLVGFSVAQEAIESMTYEITDDRSKTYQSIINYY